MSLIDDALKVLGPDSPVAIAMKFLADESAKHDAAIKELQAGQTRDDGQIADVPIPPTPDHS